MTAIQTIIVRRLLTDRIAALVKEKKAELVTGDPDFKPLQKEIKINWLE